MSRSSYKKFKDYSQKVIPPSWRELMIPESHSLLFLGKNNLELMLSEWKILLKASECWTHHVKKMGDEKVRATRYKYMLDQLKNAKFAIGEIETLLPQALPKPIIPLHRPLEGYFDENELVYVTLGMEGILLPGKVTFRNVSDEYITLTGDYEGTRVRVSHHSPLLLKGEDLRFLASNGNYLQIFAKMSGFCSDENFELYVDMINEWGKKYFPDLAEVSEPKLELY